MALIKREYKDQETVITAENLNDIQDAVIALEDGLFSIDNDKSGEVIAITDAAKRGLRSLNIYGKTTQNGTPTPDAPVDLVSVGEDGNIKCGIYGKNLIEPKLENSTSNGMSITNNGDGSYTLNGTSTGVATFRVNQTTNTSTDNLNSYCGTFTLSVRDDSGNLNPQGIEMILMETVNWAVSLRSASLPTSTIDTEKAMVYMQVPDGLKLVNFIVYPQLEAGSIVTEYEPYKGQALTISTPNGLPGIPVASGGNYTDANGQQWVCDEIDLARGVYVQRIGVKQFGDATGWGAAFNIGDRVLNDRFRVALDEVPLPYVGMSNMHSTVENWGVSEGSIGFSGSDNYVYARFPGIASKEQLGGLFSITPLIIAYGKATPVETPLSEDELAAYAALHTYKEHTTVSNDAGAWMDLEYAMDAKKYIDGLALGTMHTATVE